MHLSWLNIPFSFAIAAMVSHHRWSVGVIITGPVFKELVVECVAEFKWLGVDFIHAELHGDTCSLPEAVWDGDILQVHTLLQQRADVNSRDIMTGQLVLNIAIQQQHEPIARLLIDRGADVNQQDDISLLAPLHNATIMGNKALFRRLLKAGADVDLADREGFTPLHWSSMRGYLEVVAQLVEICGADVNRQDAMGWTPLHIACFKGYPDLVEYLLVERHARTDIEDCYGFTPMMFARIAENMDIVKRMDDYAAQQETKRLRKLATDKQTKKKHKKKRQVSSPKRLFISAKN
ncbi:hypothetical protein BBJ29_001904 [Phytophthora kernoviae]|uniref:Uncharacterized protein n=1 Tax=Phytophthora kernoviae TaxID=325452 RepID=A0A3R7HLD7_9STRA|nr:hypothetical protein BBJ29_001904 [Phytophthora kernoviae]